MLRGVVGSLVAFVLLTRQGSAQGVTVGPLLELPATATVSFTEDGATATVADGWRRARPTLLAGPPSGVMAGRSVRAEWTGPARLDGFPITRLPGGATTPAAWSAPARRARQSWWPPLASAILPGAGQGLLRQDRALAYLAIESYGWLRYASDVREGRRQRNGYRALAAQVARAYLSDESPIGDFEYYERMESFIESGVFDANPEDGVQPETNPESFNGFIWLRARTTFWEDPAIPPPPTSEQYQAALDYYANRAIQPQFRWSWRNAQLEQDLFRRTIGRSNDAFRRSIQDLGVIIANHALSTVDAYVAVRIRHAREGESGVGIEAAIPWSPRLNSFRAEERQP